MPRIELHFEAQVQQLRMTNSVQLVAGNRNYYYAVFDLDGTWSDVENKKAAFIRNGNAWVMSLETGTNSLQCQIPWEVMERDGSFGVGVFGGDRISTNLVTVNVDGSFMSEGEASLEPTVDWFKKVEELVLVGGKPGFSPIVQILDSDGGHRIYITDLNGRQEAYVPNGKDANVLIAKAGKTAANNIADAVKDGKPVCAIWPNNKVMWLKEASVSASGVLNSAVFSDGVGTVTVKPGSWWSDDGINILNNGEFKMSSKERAIGEDYTVTMNFRLTGESIDHTINSYDDRDEGLYIRPLNDTTNPNIDINTSNNRVYRYAVRLSHTNGAQLIYYSNYNGDYAGVLRGYARDSAKHADYAVSSLPQSLEKGKDYTIKIGKVGDTLKLKVWAVGTTEPDWQATYSNVRISDGGGLYSWGFEISFNNLNGDTEGAVVSDLVFVTASGETFWNGVSDNETIAREIFTIAGGTWGEYVAQGNNAMPISGGTFTGAAYAMAATSAAAQLRNTALVASDTNPTVNGQINWTYG